MARIPLLPVGACCDLTSRRPQGGYHVRSCGEPGARSGRTDGRLPVVAIAACAYLAVGRSVAKGSTNTTTACTWAVPGQGVLLGVTSLKLMDHAIELTHRVMHGTHT